MSSGIPATRKCCATCDYWGGSRRPSLYRNSVVYDGNQDKGEYIGGGWNRSQMSADQSCRKWKEWHIWLKIKPVRSAAS